MITRIQIKSIAKQISKELKNSKIILFGSYAKGNQTEQSDVDICVITELNGKRKIDLIREIRRQTSKNFHNSFDILVYEKKDFEERAFLTNSFENEISTNGIWLSE